MTGVIGVRVEQFMSSRMNVEPPAASPSTTPSDDAAAASSSASADDDSSIQSVCVCALPLTPYHCTHLLGFHRAAVAQVFKIKQTELAERIQSRAERVRQEAAALEELSRQLDLAGGPAKDSVEGLRAMLEQVSGEHPSHPYPTRLRRHVPLVLALSLPTPPPRHGPAPFRQCRRRVWTASMHGLSMYWQRRRSTKRDSRSIS